MVRIYSMTIIWLGWIPAYAGMTTKTAFISTTFHTHAGVNHTTPAYYVRPGTSGSASNTG